MEKYFQIKYDGKEAVVKLTKKGLEVVTGDFQVKSLSEVEALELQLESAKQKADRGSSLTLSKPPYK